jgi:hypothetical protein
MPAMSDRMVYDILNDGRGWWSDLLLPAGLFAAIFCVVLLISLRCWLDRTKIYIMWIALAAAGIGISMALYGDFDAHRRVQEAVRSGKYEKTEGTITEYQERRDRTSQASGSYEFFVVNGLRFVVEGGVKPFGFRTTINDGSPLAVGERVRIGYLMYNNEAIIVRLEMI